MVWFGREDCRQIWTTRPIAISTTSVETRQVEINCQTTITKQWNHQLKEETKPKTASLYVDLESLSISTPMRVWQQAGLNSAGSKEANVVSRM